MIKLFFYLIVSCFFSISCAPDYQAYTLFEENGKWGYRNDSGEIVIPASYIIAHTFNEEGIAAVIDDSGWVYINMREERLVRPYIVDNGPDYFNGGLARFIHKGKIGFINRAAEIVIPAKFTYVRPFSEGFAAFCEGCRQVQSGEYQKIEGGKWGFVNINGQIHIGAKYDEVGDFKNGEVQIILNGKKNTINIQGRN